MKLTKKALLKIDNRDTRLKLALALKVSERWISKCIETNEEDSILTKAIAISKIMEETGLTHDQIITKATEVSAHKVA